MRPNTHFYNIPGKHLESTFGSMLEILLRTRVDLKLETNKFGYDEDVNAYLAGVMVAYIDPKYLLAASKVLSSYEVDVFQAVQKAKDTVQAYWVYKVNADDRLFYEGIFRRDGMAQPERVEEIRRYYRFASEFQKRIYRKVTAVADVQVKIADKTQLYLDILAATSGKYMQLIDQLKDQDFDQLESSLNRYETELSIKAKHDELLDVYSRWLNATKDPHLKGQILDLLEELKQIDPHFDDKNFIKHVNIS